MLKRGEVHAGLHLFTQSLHWRVKLFYTYSWVMEHISSLVQTKYSSQHYSFLLATQKLSSSLIQRVQQKSSPGVNMEVLMKQESEFLFTEPKNELHKHAKHSRLQADRIYFEEKKNTMLSAQTLRGGEVPEKVGIAAVYMLASIELYILSAPFLNICHF